MSITTTYTAARARFKKMCDDVALISSDELESLMETAHSLRSPKNASRLISALLRAQKREGKKSTAAHLRKELGLD